MRKIAITGKGGSGKTAITAIMTGLLAANGNVSLLAIDADSAGSLPYALGMSPGNTVSDIRREIIEDPHTRDEIYSRHIQEVMGDIAERGDGFDLMAMGRPEGPGCYCATNELLKYGIDSLAARYDLTLIDCEAGPEQVNRRVVNGVDYVVIVTDMSMRGIRAAKEISEVVASETGSSQTGLIINRYRNDDKLMMEMASGTGLTVLGTIPEDENLIQYDMLDKPITGLPGDSPSVLAVKEILYKMNI